MEEYLGAEGVEATGIDEREEVAEWKGFFQVGENKAYLQTKRKEPEETEYEDTKVSRYLVLEETGEVGGGVHWPIKAPATSSVSVWGTPLGEEKCNL